jgi:hypothetical protein
VRRNDSRRQLDDVAERDSGFQDPVEVVAVRSGRDPNLRHDHPEGHGLAYPDPGPNVIKLFVAVI